MRRIERLINLIAALLDSRRPMTAAEIRERIAGYQNDNFEAFRRSFERDKAELREMGIPIEVVKDADDVDAYTIPPGKYYMPDLDLQPDELAALKLAADAVLGAGDQASSGLRKLSVESEADGMATPRVVWSADVAAEQPLLGPLLAALLDREPVRFEYETGDGRRSSRRVEPYSLVHRRGHWYLVGRDADRAAIRSFKVSRVVSDPEKEEGSYEIPADFDLDRHTGVEPWEVGEGEQVVARIHFDPSLAWWPQQNMTGLRLSQMDDGGVEVDMPVSNLDALVSWAIGFSDGIEIVSPPEARDRLVRHLAPFTGGGA
ncbi:MAG TPA: WYL domain-containing protein [Actinomycetota bacterium]|nr:WYL domain-containing protein [Actinomycetota bacterium]